MRSSLSTMRNKTDRNDALGIAQMMRMGWYRAVHIKGQENRRLRTMLANRKLLKRKLVDLENHIRGSLRIHGLRVGAGRPQILWKLPVYATVNNILTNPVYAGAYAFGRTGSRTMIENGRKRVLRGFRKGRSDWEVLLIDHREGYLSWAEYERNQQLIADNANSKGMMVRGAVRKGEALPLMRCGHCGRRLQVSYNGTNGDIGRYNCDLSGQILAPILASRSEPCESTRQ